MDVEAGTQVNKGASHAYFVADQTDADHNLVPLNLPSDEKFLLVLRSANDQDNEPDAIKDIAGNGFFSLVEAAPGYDPDHRYDTRLFPLNGWAALGDVEPFGDNTFASATQSYGRVTELNSLGVYRPNSRVDNRTHKDDWQAYGYMGGPVMIVTLIRTLLLAHPVMRT